MPLVAAIVAVTLTVGAMTLAGVVWRRRRQGAARARRGIAAFALLVGAAFLFLVSLSFHLLTARDGTLQAHDLFVVRAEPGRGVPRLAADADEPCADGTALVRFEQPASDAEIQAMELELEATRNDLACIQARALDIDPKLRAETLQLEADHRQLVQRRQTARSALGFTATQVRIEILAQQARLHDATTEVERIRGRQQRNVAELAYARALAASQNDLQRQQLLSSLEAQLGAQNVEALAADAARLERELTSQLQLARELAAGIAALQGQLDAHRGEVEQELATVDAELVRVGRRRAEVASAAHADLDRLATLRAAELKERELHLAALAAQIDQKRREQQIVAPGAGRVLYRHPAPAACPAGEAILAFGPEHAVRARLRLGEAEAERLAATGELRLRVTADLEEPRFLGAFLGMRRLDTEPGVALVELGCQPSQSVLRRLLAEPRLEVRLDWTPPLYADPVFDLAVGLFLCYLLVLLGGRLRRRGGARVLLHPLTSAPAKTAKTAAAAEA